MITKKYIEAIKLAIIANKELAGAMRESLGTTHFDDDTKEEWVNIPRLGAVGVIDYLLSLNMMFEDLLKTEAVENPFNQRVN